MGPKAPNPSDRSQESKKRKASQPMAGSSNKRQGKDEASNVRNDHKRVKFRDARSIHSQPMDAALRDGELAVSAFLDAREFEIRALEDGMRRSKAFSNRRAFQVVPRSMRRRTASHNVKKLPKRLRQRARREQLDDNTPVVESRKRRPRSTRARIRAETAKKLGILAKKKRTKKLNDAAEKTGADISTSAKLSSKQFIETRPARPKIRRNVLNQPPKPKAKFRKREIEKTWLPTHLWHTKRASMTEPKTPLWRFAIPMTPTEKCYRTTHRATGQRGAVIWDMSYISTIGVYGLSAGIERVLKALGMIHDSLWDDRGTKWRSGERSWTGVLSKENSSSRRDIGPATVMWNPKATFVTEETSLSKPQKHQRQLYIRVHPSCFLELFTILTKLVKRETPQLYIEDLRFEIGSIELAGPGATEALLGVIRPYNTKEGSTEAHATFFDSLKGVRNSAAVPHQTVLGFSIQDPRLCYPPRTVAQADAASYGPDPRLLNLLSKGPEKGQKPFELFDRSSRFKATCLPAQRSINRRKGSNPPGEAVQVTLEDPPIPVMLLASNKPAPGSWTLLAPWKCILPIWYSLVHYPLSTGGNPRFGGLNEVRQVAFEHNVPWFPGDFPGTDAGAWWELEQREKRQRDWNKRPKSKRVEWTSVILGAGRKGEVGSGFACDYEHLFGLKQSETPSGVGETIGGDSGKEGSAHCKNDATSEAMDVDVPETELTSVDEHAQIIEKRDPSALASIKQISKATFNALASRSSTDDPPPYSLITISLTQLSRGVPEACARIYRLPNPAMKSIPSAEAEVPATQRPSSTASTLPDDLREQWLAKAPTKASKPTRPTAPHTAHRIPPGTDMETRKRLVARSIIATELPFPRPQPNQGDVGGHPLVPDEGDLIGFVTTGSFNLKEGRGVGLGCVSAQMALEALRAGGDGEGRLCVVRNVGEGVGWLARWELV